VPHVPYVRRDGGLGQTGVALVPAEFGHRGRLCRWGENTREGRVRHHRQTSKTHREERVHACR
jgi:hypothetical protein